MPIFRNNVEEAAMQVHRVHQLRIGTKQADMNSLPMHNIDRLGVRKAFSTDDIIAAKHTHKSIILYIRMNGLYGLWTSWARIDNKGAIHATCNLFCVIIVAVVPVCTYIL